MLSAASSPVTAVTCGEIIASASSSTRVRSALASTGSTIRQTPPTLAKASVLPSAGTTFSSLAPRGTDRNSVASTGAVRRPPTRTW